MSSPNNKSRKLNGLNITRRDFVNGTLVGAGSVMLSGCLSPIGSGLKPSMATAPHDAWTGPGGIGDYKFANGNTQTVRLAAHAVRDSNITNKVKDSGEEYDLVVVGGGFTGMSAALTYQQKNGYNAKVLVLDNHAMFGGVAKLNEFEVDGHRLMAPQGSDMFLKPSANSRQVGWIHRYWDELGLPKTTQELDNLLVKKPLKGTDKALHPEVAHYATGSDTETSEGYFFKDEKTGSYTLVRETKHNQWQDCPIPARVKSDLVTLFDDDNGPLPYEGDDWLNWLDGFTYKHYIEEVMKLDPGVTAWLNAKLAYKGGGLGGEVVSARNAFLHQMPGVARFTRRLADMLGADAKDLKAGLDVAMFPGGNSCILRHFVKKLIPAAISGGHNLNDIMNGAVNFDALDRRRNPTRIRLSSMVSEVRHQGDPDSAESVTITYMDVNTQKMLRVKARGVVVATPGMISKRILSDLPQPLYRALDSYTHAPMLTVNVALKNWRFMERKGVTSVYDHGDNFAAYFNIRQALSVGDYDEPFDPDKPVILTIYKSFENDAPELSQLNGKQKAKLARFEMLSKSYADYEKEVLHQLTELFGDSGFDPVKDVAGITLNRWGHDFIVTEPGFFVGEDGSEESGVPATVARGYGLVGIAHSELNGIQNWIGATEHGERAAKQIIRKQKRSSAGKTIEGDWLVSESNSVIRISIKDGVAAGIIISVAGDTSLVERRRLINMPIIKGLVNNGEKWKDGIIEDPTSGQEYSCQLFMESDDELAVRAYLGSPVFGQGFVWTRVKATATL